MPFDPYKKRDEQDSDNASPAGDGGNPYSALTGSSSASTASPGGAAQPQYTGAAPAPGATAMPGGMSGPSATGYVNFDRLYDANAGVAEREAGKLQTSAQQKGKNFQQGLTGAQGAFGQKVRAGTVQAPSEAAKGWGQYGAGVESAPNRTAGGNATAPLTNADVQNEINTGAAGKYSGPGALSEDTDAYSKLAQEAADTQDYANALGSGNEGLQGLGMNQTDAALLGAAGRPGFADVARQYGDTKGELERANTASMSAADAARRQSEEDAKSYQGLLDQRGAADEEEARKQKEMVDNALGAGDSARDQLGGGASGTGKGVKYPNLHMTATGPNGEVIWNDQVDSGVIDRGTGRNKSFDDAKDPSNATNVAKYLGVDIKDADYVISVMTPEDWKAFHDAADRGPDAMRKWFDAILARRGK